MNKTARNILFSKYSFLFLAVILFTVSFFFHEQYSGRSSVSREVKLLEKYLHKEQQSFAAFLADTALVRKLASKTESVQELNSLISGSHGSFLYVADMFGRVQMRFWSDQLAVPPPEIFGAEDGEYFQQLNNGYYLIEKRTFSLQGIEESIIAFALIPVRFEFFIETDYLPRRFAHSAEADKWVALSQNESAAPVTSLSGKRLFQLEARSSGAVPYSNKLTIVLRLCALLFLFFFVHLLAESIAKKKGVWVSIGVLVAVIAAIRIIIYLYPSLLNLRQFELFDPSIYGSNVVQRSLGDLLINSFLFCWIVLFAWSKLSQTGGLTNRFSATTRWIAGFVSLCLLIFSTFMLASVIRSIIADSKISFDVTDFFSLNRFTVFGFIALASLSLSYYYFTQLLFRLIFPLFEGRSAIIYFAICFAGLVYLTVRSGDPTVLFYIPVLGWLLLYTWFIQQQGVLFQSIRINIAGILFWIFIFSVSIASIMLVENKDAEWKRRKNFAEKLAMQTDPASERLLNIALQYLDSDFLSDNYHRFADPERSKKLRDSIVTENYSGYLNKYDTRLYVYDAAGMPVNNDDPATYDDLNTMLAVEAKPTTTPGLFIYETAFDQFMYITKREIADDDGQMMGYLFILSNPKKFSSDALFPELFRQFRQNDPESSPIYSYAIYNNKRLVSPSTKYPFAIWLRDAEMPKHEFEKRVNGDHDELWYKASNEKVVVMVRKQDSLLETITLFSYIFCSFLFLVAIVRFLSLLLRTFSSRQRISSILQLNIRSQVHSTIIFISVLSFVIIGISTISFFISRYERNNNEKLSRTMQIMVNEMQKELADHSTFDDVVKIYDSVSNFNLQNLVNDVSDIHGVDVNVYDLEGNLYVSSEANVYNKGVLSKKMDPSAYFHLSRERLVQHAEKEKIGKLSYLSIYAPVRDEYGNAYAYVNIPYFTSQPELNQEISNFLVTLINLNAFIFLVAGLIALFITNRITRSFSLISEKMREVNLGKLNEEIVWSRNDEIGGLVTEYNKMVAKLGASAEALAKSEREGAWREMARQVAHEIKNPLTPMKLSIQYLQKAIDNNQPNVKELSSSVAHTLVEQIDHLSKIAADFSQFANIGNTNVTRFDLHQVIASLKELYNSDERTELLWSPVDDELLMEADKTQMNRLFTNLFANAVEACSDSGFCRIEVTEKLQAGAVRISVKDNGEGIAPEMQSRIFVPNFTTKSSGTGLGLAMCKGIVEQAGGTIWFETEQGKGTVFYVELPLVTEK